MSNPAFDPYHKWLGIPPHEQPPDHYRLLGISRFESDPDVIDHAADGRMALLRSFQIGPNAAASQKLISKIAIARACLLNESSRQEYDAWLTSAAPSLPTATAEPPPQPPEPPAPLALPVAITAPQRRALRATRSSAPELLKIVGGGLAGIVLGYLVVRGLLGIDMLAFITRQAATTGSMLAGPAAPSAPETAPPDGTSPSEPTKPAEAPAAPESHAIQPRPATAPSSVVSTAPRRPRPKPPAGAPAEAEPPPLVLELQTPAPAPQSAPPAAALSGPPAAAALFQADGTRAAEGQPPEVNTIQGWKDAATTALSKDFQQRGSLVLRRIAERREQSPFALREEEIALCRKAAVELLTAKPRKARDDATELVVHVNSLHALRWVGDASCNSLLLEHLTDKRPEIREAAMRALEVHADNACVVKLKGALRMRGTFSIDLPYDPPFMQRTGIGILARLGTPEARDALGDLLASSRNAAAKEEIRRAIDSIEVGRK